MSNTDYTQLFERILIPAGVKPEFPLDLLKPDLMKQVNNQTWPKSSRGMIYNDHPNQGVEFVTQGDYVMVPMLEISGSSTTTKEVENQIETKINDYCMEMIQCEQRYSFPSNRKNRIIVYRGISVCKGGNNPSSYYGWDQVGFLIIRVVK